MITLTRFRRSRVTLMTAEEASGPGQGREGKSRDLIRPARNTDNSNELDCKVRYWSAHAQPVICHPELPFFKDIVTIPLSVTGLPSLVYVSVVGVTRYA